MSVSVKPIIIRLDHSCYLLVGWLCLTSHRKQGYLEMAPPFSVPYEGREAWFLSGIEPQIVAWKSITQPLRHS